MLAPSPMRPRTGHLTYPVRVRQQPEQQAPPVQRLRIRYAKRGRLRFTSHRDFSRAFERAVFRARIPMAYSSGFNPHPRISYAGAAPTGSASEAEYLEIALAQVVDPAAVHAELEEALPPGLDVLQRWSIDVTSAPDVTAAAVEGFLAHDSVLVERMTKKGLREFDCRAAVVSLGLAPHEGGTRLDLVLRHATTPAVRPDDVLRGLAQTSGLEMGSAPLLTRQAQGPLDPGTGTVGDPLA